MAPSVAVDVGTGETKIFVGTVDGAADVTEVYRFESRRIDRGDDRVWDLDHLVDGVWTGIELADEDHGPLASVGIDATAEMIGLVADGEIIAPPVHTDSVHTARELDGLSATELFVETGHSRLPNRYHALHRSDRSLVDRADWVGLFPALIAHELGATPHGELSYAISAGLGNTRTRHWADSVLERLGLETDCLPELATVGSVVGTLDADDIVVEGAPDIVVVPGHDTSAAVAGIPFTDATRAFLATGSWFITGYEVDAPVVSDRAIEASAENMGGVDGTARFVRNTPGFSLLEHCRAEWRAAGHDYGYDELLRAAEDTDPFGPLIDPGHELLLDAHFSGEALPTIREFCRLTDQDPPRSVGAVTRCLLESLAASAALLLDRLGDIADRDPQVLHLVGGGVRNELLCRMVAAAGVTVLAGPGDATAIGSILCQSRATGHVESIAEGRRIVGESYDIERYEPVEADRWTDALARMDELRTGSPTK